jgi:glycosyltransferase involved in cell wall biosynthesis
MQKIYKKDGCQKKTNLLFLLQTLGTGGSERIVKSLCENLDQRMFRCFVISLIDGEMKKEFMQLDIPVYSLDKRGHDAFKIMRQISTFIKTNQIHVINAHHFSPFLHAFYGAKKHGCKIFFTPHSSWEIELMSNNYTAFCRILLTFSNGAIGISPSVSESILKKFHLPKHKVFTIINSVDYRRFNTNVDVRKKKQELNIKKQEKVIGAVGGLRRVKNYSTLIKAFKIVKEKIDNVKLIIIGEGKMRGELEDLTKDLNLSNKVLFLGVRSDIPELMKLMDVYCLTSFFEGLPLSLLEAMSAGVPILGTDVPGIRDVIIQEQTGLLVSSDNHKELAEGLIRVLTHPFLARKLAKNGKNFVLENYSIEMWISQYEKLFAS